MNDLGFDIVHDIVLLVIWMLAASSAAQSVIHLLSAWMLYGQESGTPVGVTLSHRELTLGIKAALRTVFDALLAIAVTWNVDVESWVITPILLPLVALSAVVAIWYGVRFMVLMQHENWGRPAPSNDRAMNQISRQLTTISREARSAVRDAATEAVASSDERSRVLLTDSAKQTTLLEVKTIVSHVEPDGHEEDTR